MCEGRAPPNDDTTENVNDTSELAEGETGPEVVNEGGEDGVGKGGEGRVGHARRSERRGRREGRFAGVASAESRGVRRCC